MAEAIGLGASVLTFIAVAAKLSSATATLHNSIKDAPSDVQRVQTRLKDLEFILAQIDRTCSMNPECVGDPTIKSYWTGKEAKLRSDFAEFGNFAAQLTTNIGKAKGRVKWFLSHEDRAMKVLGLLAEDIDLLMTLLGIMESNVIGKIYRAQAPIITTATQVAQIVDRVNATMVTKQEFADHRNRLRLMLKPCIQNPHAPQSTLSTAQDSDILTSGVVMSYANYYFPLGRISLWCGWRSRETGQHATDEESLLVGRWDFNPASWVSYRSMQIQARLLVQFGEYSKPRVTPNLTFRVCVSDDHPVWECIQGGDLAGVQRHLSIRSIGVNDTTLWGETLLNKTCSYLLDIPDDEPACRARYLQILQLLVESGAEGEGEGHCRVKIGPKNYEVFLQLGNDRRTALSRPQSTSLAAIDILLSAGADISPRLCYQWDSFSLYPVSTVLAADHRDQYIDGLKEFLLDALSRDLLPIEDLLEAQALAGLLTEICCGRLPDLWDTWRQRHALPADTEFSPGPLVDKIVSTVLRILLPTIREGTIYQLLNTVFRTGDIDAGNGILSLFITRSPNFAASLGDLFTWREATINPPVNFLGKYSDSTQGLLERCGADPSCIMYYRMASVPEIAYWEEVFGKGVDGKVLNSLLLFSAAYCPIGHAEYLVAKGSCVNFRSIAARDDRQGWTALAYAADRGEREVVRLLLNNGADALLERGMREIEVFIRTSTDNGNIRR